MTGFKVESAILCEDIRQEKSNKFILIGVYSGPILVSQFPMSISLAVFVIGTPEEQEGLVTLRFSGPGEDTALLKMGYRRSDDNTFAALSTPVLQIALQQEGTLLIEISADGESWEPLLSRDVSQADGLWSLTPIVSGQPSEQSPNDAPAS